MAHSHISELKITKIKLPTIKENYFYFIDLAIVGLNNVNNLEKIFI